MSRALAGVRRLFDGLRGTPGAGRSTASSAATRRSWPRCSPCRRRRSASNAVRPLGELVESWPATNSSRGPAGALGAQRLASGGMSTVWVAGRAGGLFRQRVAIKLLRGGVLGAAAPKQLAPNARSPACSIRHRACDGGFDAGGYHLSWSCRRLRSTSTRRPACASVAFLRVRAGAGRAAGGTATSSPATCWCAKAASRCCWLRHRHLGESGRTSSQWLHLHGPVGAPWRTRRRRQRRLSLGVLLTGLLAGAGRRDGTPGATAQRWRRWMPGDSCAAISMRSRRAPRRPRARYPSVQELADLAAARHAAGRGAGGGRGYRACSCVASLGRRGVHRLDGAAVRCGRALWQAAGAGAARRGAGGEPARAMLEFMTGLFAQADRRRARSRTHRANSCRLTACIRSRFGDQPVRAELLGAMSAAHAVGD